MKKIVLAGFILMLFNGIVLAEEFSVRSFRLVESDLTAKLRNLKDQNGDVCALVKIITAQEGLTFKVAGLGIVAVEKEDGEYHLYIPHGSRLLTIRHPEYETLDYFFSKDIREGLTYEMRLTLPEKKSEDRKPMESQYLVLNVRPIDAVVYIDNKITKLDDKGELSKLLPCGPHNLRLEHRQCVTKYMNVNIVKDRKTELNIEMASASTYGSLSVQTAPMDATLFLNGKEYGNTPQYVPNLVEGEYEMRLEKKGYESIKLGVKIEKEQAQNMSLIMNVAKPMSKKKQRVTLTQFIEDNLKGVVYWELMKLRMYMGAGIDFDKKFSWTFRGDFFLNFRFHMFEVQPLTISYEIIHKRLFFEPTVGLHFPVSDWCALKFRVGPSFTAKKSSDYLHEYFGICTEIAWRYYTDYKVGGEVFLHSTIPYNTLIREGRRCVIDMGISFNLGMDID